MSDFPENNNNEINQNVEAQTYISAEAYSSVENSAMPSPVNEEKKDRRMGVIVAIIAAVVVLIAAGATTYIFAGEVLANKFAMMTKSDVNYFKWVANKQVKKTFAQNKKASKNGTGMMSLEDINAKGLNGRSSVKFHAEEEFFDMLNIYPFKDMELGFNYTYKDGDIAFGLEPKYGDKILANLNFLLNLKQHKLMVQLPTYRSEIIDLSAVAEEGFAQLDEIDFEAASKEFTEEFEEVIKYIQPIVDKANKDPEAFAKRYLSAIIDSVRDVEVVKDKSVKVNKENKEFTDIKVNVKGSDLADLIDELTEMICDDAELKLTSQQRQELGDALKEIDSSIAIVLDMYVDNKGNIVGCDAGVKVAATKVSVEVMSYTEDGYPAQQFALNVSGIKAVEGKIVSRGDDENVDTEVTLELGSLIQSLLGDNGKWSLGIRFTGTVNDASITYAVNKNNKLFASLGMSTSISDYKAPLVDASANPVIDADGLLNSDYVSIPDIIRFALNIVEAIDEDYIYEAINDALSEYGLPYTVEDIRNLLDQGYFDIFDDSLAGIIDSASGIGVPEAAPILEYIPTLVSPLPEEYTASDWELPAEDAVLNYSKFDLWQYASVKNYKGLEFTVPRPAETEELNREELKRNYINSFGSKYKLDASSLETQMGDGILFDIVPIVGGFAMNFYSYNDCYALLGNYEYGDGLDDKILGMKVGETRDVEATLDERYGAFEGTSATFRLNLKDIERYITPEWNEDFVCGNLGFSSLEELEELLVADALGQGELDKEYAIYSLISDAMDASTFYPIPEGIYNNLVQSAYNRIYDYTVGFGMRPENYYTEDIADSNALWAFADALNREVTDSALRASFYASIAKTENITATGSEVRDYITSNYDIDPDTELDFIKQYITLDEITDYIIETKIEALILSNANIIYE